MTNEIKLGVIDFKDLSNFDESTSAIFMEVILTQDDLPGVNEYFKDVLGLSVGKNLIGAYRILGNVLGNIGRMDYLLEFDHPEIPFDPVVKLQLRDVKWISEFKVSCAKDYIPNYNSHEN